MRPDDPRRVDFDVFKRMPFERVAADWGYVRDPDALSAANRRNPAVLDSLRHTSIPAARELMACSASFAVMELPLSVRIRRSGRTNDQLTQTHNLIED